ncbi:cell envelope integrity protein TolA [Herminiimonas sp. CN]|uniref:cell envelope integrity protein TolA n=1 Tax=Herminiimonas sp. CN TaxID=1349818 RepID=UPI0004742313|nr:cell envelope integrity protein TolA [Herminiimonas sp. CN]
MNASTPYSVPREPGRWRAIALAAVVHAALFAFLWIGIRWQNEKPLAVEAEIWSPSTQEAAPVAAQNMPEPQPEQPPEKLLEKPVPAPEPPPAVATPQVEKPDIALEQEKKRKVRQEQQEQEQRLAQKRHEQELLKKQQAQKEALKQKEAQAEKEKALAQKKREAEEASKIAAAAKDKKHKQDLAKQAALAAEDSKLAKLRDENLRRMTGNSSSSTSGSGTAAKSQGNRGDPGYVERIRAKIKSNTIFNVPNDLNGNPEAVYELSLLPDGSIRSLHLKKSSGVAGFDEAVKRGIEKSEPYPKDKSGEVPSSINLTYKPKD